MARFKVTLEYAGTRYSGWQIQANARTVQGELHRALREVLGGAKFETYGSGRTDAGVHALAQVAHLDTGATLPPATLTVRLNDALPHDINVLSIERVSPRFHARRSAVASLERGETTLAAYRRVLSPPIASASLVDKIG